MDVRCSYQGHWGQENAAVSAPAPGRRWAGHWQGTGQAHDQRADSTPGHWQVHLPATRCPVRSDSGRDSGPSILSPAERPAAPTWPLANQGREPSIILPTGRRGGHHQTLARRPSMLHLAHWQRRRWQPGTVTIRTQALPTAIKAGTWRRSGSILACPATRTVYTRCRPTSILRDSGVQRAHWWNYDLSSSLRLVSRVHQSELSPQEDHCPSLDSTT